MKISGRRVLITGGAGFIGSELTRQAAAVGASVVVVDNLVNGKKENLADIPGKRVRLEVTDIRNASAMKRLMKGTDLVFHLACLGVRHSIHSPAENHEVNASATLSLLAAAREARVGRFVCVSSSEIYGTAKMTPITENCPPYPHTVYGASKLAGECYARAYWDTYRFPTVVIRPFNSYGLHCHHEGDSGEVIPKFLLRACAGKPLLVFGDGKQTRDFTFVSDTARAILLAGTARDVVGETINVGYGEEITVNKLAKLVSDVAACGKPDIRHVDPRPGDVRRLWADTRKARRLLKYKPAVTMTQGLELLKKWYESLGKSPTELLKDEVELNWKK